MRVDINKGLVCLVFLALSAQAHAGSRNSADAPISPQELMRHEIFANVYYQPQKIETKKKNKVKEALSSLKKMVQLQYDETLTFKVSSVKSGPLSQSMTQMVEMAPGIQTHDGLIGDSSKGYGIKFSYQFD